MPTLVVGMWGRSHQVTLTMPDVLILSEYPTLSGGERSLLAVLEGVAHAGFSVSVAAPPEGALADALRARHIEVLPLTLLGPEGRRLPQDVLRRQLAQLIARQRPDLVHANSLSMGRLSGPVVADLGIASIAHLRDIIKLSARAVADLNCHARLLAVSEATRSYHVAAGIDSEKTHVLYNGIDLDRFRPRRPTGYLHRELGLEPGVKLAGTIGQIGMRKGLDVLALAAIELKNHLPDLHYVVVGRRWSDKAEAREYETRLQAVAENELAGRMHLIGLREDVPELLSEWTLLIHAARQEPLGRVLIEAAASGTPVVATNAGGTSEIFPPGTAELVEPDDPGALATAIAEVAGSDLLRSRLATSARRRAEETFDASLSATALARHYADVCTR